MALIWIAGGSHADADLFGNLPEGLPLRLERNPDNPYDPNAVAVMIDRAPAEAQGIRWPNFPDGIKEAHRLGYLPASRGTNWTPALAPHLDAGKGASVRFVRHSSRNPLAMQIEVTGEAMDGCGLDEDAVTKPRAPF